MRLSVRSVCLAALAIALGLAHGTARAHHFTPAAPAQRLTGRLGDADVAYIVVPEKPRAGAEVLVAIEITQHGSHAPLAGPLVVEVAREAAISRLVSLGPPDTLAHDAGFPGEFTLRVVPPTSGLYRVTLHAPVLGPGAEGRLEISVWSSGRNPFVAIPAGVIVLLLAVAVARSRRASRSKAAPGARA